MVKELDCLSVQGKVMRMLIIEEVYCMLIQPEGESLQEGNIISHDLLVREIELMDNY